MATQTESGKAFEYAIIQSIYNNTHASQQVSLITDNAYQNTERCYISHGEGDRALYDSAADAAFRHLITLEPRLLRPSGTKDSLILKIQEDFVGMHGDARDVLTIRTSQGWEIGISAKNNHEAVRHSRLSDRLDFGIQWLGIPCSRDYFGAITPVFTRLRQLKENNANWNQIADKDVLED